MTGPPFPSWACRGGRVQSEDLPHAQPDGDRTKLHHLRATLACTDLATDLVRGKCAPSACSRSPGPPLISCMPHGTGVPFVTTWAVAWGPRPWQASGNPQCPSTRREGLTLGTSIGLPCLTPTPLQLSNSPCCSCSSRPTRPPAALARSGSSLAILPHLAPGHPLIPSQPALSGLPHRRHCS